LWLSPPRESTARRFQTQAQLPDPVYPERETNRLGMAAKPVKKWSEILQLVFEVEAWHAAARADRSDP
jgi:hypothetical protein